jgi:polysaccharide chain length determinant protein (PEP-CTERM system associated)
LYSLARKLMDSFDITKYLDMAIKRKWWIIIPFLVSILGGLDYALNIQKVYEAQTLILVQPQRVPENFVRSIVSETVEDRLRTITQEVTSRTNLEKIIQQFRLYESASNQMLLDDKVALMRKMITIDVSRRGRSGETNAFTISFRGLDPKKITQITNALASNFILENILIRESQATGTSVFLSDELESVKRQLMKKEEELKKYRENNMGGLPEQLQTNLRILERFQAQQDQNNDSLRDAENRKIAIQRDIAESRALASTRERSVSGQDEEGRILTSLRNELATLQARYTENHPDIIRLKETITKVEEEQSKSDVQIVSPEEAPVDVIVDHDLRRQLREIDLRIEQLKLEIEQTEDRIELYQKKIEETPKREQELITLNRDYNNLQGLYNSLLNRKLEADIALSMEKKQKGEQFRVIDPAKVPSRPVEPEIQKIIMLTLVLGLGLGCGLAYLMEFMDSSYKNPQELEDDLQLPVLINLPYRYTEIELKRTKWKNILAYTSVSVGFVISAVSIVLSIKGVDATLEYVKGFMERM